MPARPDGRSGGGWEDVWDWIVAAWASDCRGIAWEWPGYCLSIAWVLPCSTSISVGSPGSPYAVSRQYRYHYTTIPLPPCRNFYTITDYFLCPKFAGSQPGSGHTNAGPRSQILRKFFANLRRSLRGILKESKRICEEIGLFSACPCHHIPEPSRTCKQGRLYYSVIENFSNAFWSIILKWRI